MDLLGGGLSVCLAQHLGERKKQNWTLILGGSGKAITK